MDLRIEVTWSLVAQLLDAGARPNQAEAYRKRLVALLSTQTAATVSRLHFELHVLRAQSRQRALWAAASLRLGHWLDDGEFSEFRAWLIAHGEIVWRRAVADPDALVELPVRIDRKGIARAALAPLNATPGKLYLKLVADDHALDQQLRAEHDAWCAALPDSGDDTAIGWAYWNMPDPDELARTFPRLWAACGPTWPAEQPDPFADFRRELDVPGLGRVRLGDTLIRRHDQKSFVIEGLSLPFGSASDWADEGAGAADAAEASALVIARVRHADGTVACNQVLSRQYQRWPHEPTEGALPGDPPGGWDAADAADDPADDAHQAAWEARDKALQTRIAAEIEGEHRVIYAAAPEDEDGLPRDNLDEIAVRGAVRFIETDPQDGERFESDVLENPTWLQIAVLANRMMCQLQYDHYVYLEDIEIVRRPKGQPKIAAFVLGS